jgi:hypothetical protein
MSFSKCNSDPDALKLIGKNVEISKTEYFRNRTKTTVGVIKISHRRDPCSSHGGEYQVFGLRERDTTQFDY